MVLEDSTDTGAVVATVCPDFCTGRGSANEVTNSSFTDWDTEYVYHHQWGDVDSTSFQSPGPSDVDQSEDS